MKLRKSLAENKYFSAVCISALICMTGIGGLFYDMESGRGGNAKIKETAAGFFGMVSRYKLKGIMFLDGNRVI